MSTTNWLATFFVLKQAMMKHLITIKCSITLVTEVSNVKSKLRNLVLWRWVILYLFLHLLFSLTDNFLSFLLIFHVYNLSVSVLWIFKSAEACKNIPKRWRIV